MDLQLKYLTKVCKTPGSLLLSRLTYFVIYIIEKESLIVKKVNV